MAGVAVAEGIRSRFPDAEIVFFSTGNALERRCLAGRGFGFFPLRATGWRGSLKNMAVFFFGFILSLLRCIWALRSMRPDVVFGLGGYASLAPAISAFLLRVPVILLEQNVIPGRANRFLSRWAQCVLCHWPSTGRWFGGLKGFHLTGTPLREELFGYQRQRAADLFGLSPQGTTLLVLGGSQGAKAVNKAVMACLPSLVERFTHLQVIHSAGNGDYQRLKATYQRLGLRARVYDFLEEMGAAYSMADLVVSRAGATTLAELTAWGIPAVLIPYPHGTDDHQYKNALELSSRGAAVLLEERCSSAKLLEILSQLLSDPERLKRMAETSRALGRPTASREVIDLMQRVLPQEKRRGQYAASCIR